MIQFSIGKFLLFNVACVGSGDRDRVLDGNLPRRGHRPQLIPHERETEWSCACDESHIHVGRGRYVRRRKRAHEIKIRTSKTIPGMICLCAPYTRQM